MIHNIHNLLNNHLIESLHYSIKHERVSYLLKIKLCVEKAVNSGRLKIEHHNKNPLKYDKTA